MTSSAPNTTDDRDTPITAPVDFRQYRAPRLNGETFVEPGFDDIEGLLAANLQQLDQHDSRWRSMRREARSQLIKDALRYTSVYRDTSWVNPAAAERPIVMAGHQPSLFHPGVWFKNFSLNSIADQAGATAINLIVDNDVAKGSAIRVPTIDKTNGLATLTNVAYDDFGGGVPYEQTTVGNLKRFDRFDADVTKTVRPLVKDPCVQQLWPHARAAIDRCGVAGCALAQARHALEGDIGLKSLEIPLGVVCRGRAVAEFVLSILTDLPRFHDCYNDSVEIYRVAHGIRSSAHPVPNLGQQNDWFEAPLWIYGNKTPVRKAAWVRLGDGYLEISDLGNRNVKINTTNLSDAIDQLTAAMTPEFKIRPRALLTTMYSRLVLSDLFLHGIGGGKYDQLGDMVIRAFFEIDPPQFMVMSATIHLPGIQPNDLSSQIRQLKRKIRETHFQGERFQQQLGRKSDLAQRKGELLQRIPPRGQRPRWHLEVNDVNQQMSQALSGYRNELEASLATAQRQSNAQSILESREHSFCLYPLDYLTETFARLSR